MAFTKTTLQYVTQLTVTEILDGNVEGLSDKTVKHTGHNRAEKLDADTTPPVTKVASFSQALTAGAATINLTALVGTNDITVNGDGLKVQAVKMANPDTNENAITATAGASNAYNLAGADWSVALQPGQEFVFYGNDATPDISSSACEIDLSGTGTEALEVEIVMG